MGISVDGPDDLNDVRWAGTVELTREATAKTHAAIERLVRGGLTPSLIVTLQRNNATANKLPRMVTQLSTWCSRPYRLIGSPAGDRVSGGGADASITAEVYNTKRKSA